MASEGSRDFWRVIAAWFLPPVGVWMQSGVGVQLIVNLVLTLFFFFPAQLHALWLISTTGANGQPEPDGMSTFVSLLLAGLLPPVGVLMKKGVGMPLLINLVLCVLLWIPAMLHAIWVITTDD